LLVEWMVKDIDDKSWCIHGDKSCRAHQVVPGVHIDAASIVEKVTLPLG